MAVGALQDHESLRITIRPRIGLLCVLHMLERQSIHMAYPLCRADSTLIVYHQCFSTFSNPRITFFSKTSIIIIIIMVIFKCYFSGELIALSQKNIKTKNNNNNDVNIELGKTKRLKALCMMQIKK